MLFLLFETPAPTRSGSKARIKKKRPGSVARETKLRAEAGAGAAAAGEPAAAVPHRLAGLELSLRAIRTVGCGGRGVGGRGVA